MEVAADDSVTASSIFKKPLAPVRRSASTGDILSDAAPKEKPTSKSQSLEAPPVENRRKRKRSQPMRSYKPTSGAASGPASDSDVCAERQGRKLAKADILHILNSPPGRASTQGGADSMPVKSSASCDEQVGSVTPMQTDSAEPESASRASTGPIPISSLLNSDDSTAEMQTEGAAEKTEAGAADRCTPAKTAHPLLAQVSNFTAMKNIFNSLLSNFDQSNISTAPCAVSTALPATSSASSSSSSSISPSSATLPAISSSSSSAISSISPPVSASDWTAQLSLPLVKAYAQKKQVPFAQDQSRFLSSWKIKPAGFNANGRSLHDIEDSVATAIPAPASSSPSSSSSTLPGSFPSSSTTTAPSSSSSSSPSTDAPLSSLSIAERLLSSAAAAAAAAASASSAASSSAATHGIIVPVGDEDDDATSAPARGRAPAPSAAASSPAGAMIVTPKTYTHETASNLFVFAELTGTRKRDIVLNFNRNKLRITATNDDPSVLSELYRGGGGGGLGGAETMSYVASLELPEWVDEDKIEHVKTTFSTGLLEICIPKQTKKEPAFSKKSSAPSSPAGASAAGGREKRGGRARGGGGVGASGGGVEALTGRLDFENGSLRAFENDLRMGAVQGVRPRRGRAIREGEKME